MVFNCLVFDLFAINSVSINLQSINTVYPLLAIENRYSKSIVRAIQS